MTPYILGIRQRDDSGVEFRFVYVAVRERMVILVIRHEACGDGRWFWVVCGRDGRKYLWCSTRKKAVRACRLLARLTPIPVSRSARAAAR